MAIPYNPFDINRSVENVFGVNPNTDLQGIPRWGNESEYGDNGTKSPKTMQQIKNNLLNPALTSHYGVEIGIPDALRGMIPNSGGQQAQLNLMCTEAALPGSSLMTMEINNNYTGVTERHAYRRVFDDRINLTFYVDSKYNTLRLFEEWMNFISPIYDNNNKYEGSPDGQLNSYGDRNNFYRFRYPDDYKRIISITKFERDFLTKPNEDNQSEFTKFKNQPLLTYRFIDTFPTNINAIPLTYEGSSITQVSVSFNYLRHTVEKHGSQFAAIPFSF